MDDYIPTAQELKQPYLGVMKLRFVTALEQLYHLESNKQNIGFTRLALLFLAFTVLASGVIDYVLSDAEIHYLLSVRFSVAIPLLVGVFLLSYGDQYITWQQPLMIVSLVAVCAAMLSIMAVASDSLRAIYFAGFLIIIIAGFTACRLRLGAALLVGACAAIEFFVAQWSLQLPPRILVTFAYLFIGTSGLGIAVAYGNDRQLRQAFVHRCLLDLNQRQLIEANKRLQAQVGTDGLTGIANRRQFDSILSNEWQRAIRGEYAISIVMMDIDFFKAFNDAYGHQLGDVCLRKVAQSFATVAKRQQDCVARYGGEEFVAVLPHVVAAEALAIAEKARSLVCQLAVAHDHSSVAKVVTVSLGVATAMPIPGADATELLSVADQNLYKAKAEGRNRAVASSAQPPVID